MDPLERAVDEGDLDELVRWVDRLSERREWDDLVRLRDLSRAALARGRQLWPAASYTEYRLALEAPAQWAGVVLVPGAGRFALGPLSEVAASTHTWGQLAPWAPPGPVAALAAHERVVRGESVDPESIAVPALELPTELCPWEPRYATATYHADRVDAPRPDPSARDGLPSLLRPADPDALIVPDAAAESLRLLVRAWVETSNGRAEAVTVSGTALDAIAALGPRHARTVELEPGEAMALMAWAAASGGARGARRGAAVGRFDTWWALAALTGLDDDFPPDPDELGDAVAELRYLEWDIGEPDTGWALRLAIEDPADGLAWAISATDAA